VNDFKEKIKILRQEKKMGRKNTLDILREAIGELNLTEEPIANYYTLGKIIGSGKYGVVRKGTSIANPEFTVAIKIIDMNKLSSQFHSLIQEILTLKKVDHPNIVSIHEMFRDDNKLFLVLEYVEGQELFDFVTERFKLMESEA
jgi:serine/threonine protein kinase